MSQASSLCHKPWREEWPLSQGVVHSGFSHRGIWLVLN